MKVAVGQKVTPGPWGGGNQFVASLIVALRARGHVVVHDLSESDIDIALLLDPRPRVPNVTFAASALWRHRATNSRTLVVHRVNECDARKDTRTMDLRLATANAVADHTIFISQWLRTLPVWRNARPGTVSVIENGADARVFRPDEPGRVRDGAPVRLVTHHWGAHAKKGADIYAALAELCDRSEWSRRIAFTYVGNPPNSVDLRRTRMVAPLAGEALAAELRMHDAYVTGSVNEPAGMHHIEAALCGLPILFRRSGALPEYCEGYGRGFWGVADLEPALDDFLDRLGRYRSVLADYGHTAERMTARYIGLFEALLARRDEIVAARRRRRIPAIAARALEML